MTLTAGEQYLLELMNRARLDPAGEAARLGVALNQGLKAGTISDAAKQVLAPNALLEAAATGHSLWELVADTVSHVEADGSLSKARMLAQGYIPTSFGENLALIGTTPGEAVESALSAMNQSLFESASSRALLMSAGYRELGIGAEAGLYTQAGQDFAAEALTLNFGTTGTAHFLTGVAYNDVNKDAFYSVGEGTADVVFAALGKTTATAAAGGYSLALGADVATAVTGHVGALNFSLTVDMSPGNVKLDIVSGASFYTSGSVVLGTGINNVLQLGVGNLNATGNTVANVLTGNSGANTLNGLLGADKLYGNGGNDVLNGGFGNDLIVGGKGDDVMTGSVGADVFVFTALEGNDRITDFHLAEGDRLQLDDALWGNVHLKVSEIIGQFATKGTGEVVFDFGLGQQIHLVGLTGIAGLAAALDIL